MKNSIFKKMDHFIFQKIDDFKASPIANKFRDLTSSLSEGEQKILNKLFTFLILSLPLLLVFLFYLGNKNIKADIETKNNILQEIEQFTRNNNNISGSSSRIVSAYPMESQEDFQNRVNQVAGQRSINSKKITIKKFIPDDRKVTLREATGTFSFNDFTMADLTGILSGFIVNERVKISKLNIQRNNSLELLDGEIDIIHFSKAQKTTE